MPLLALGAVGGAVVHDKAVLELDDAARVDDESDTELLASCYRRALDIAAENGCDSVAFPCISAGAQRFPIYKAAPTALIAVVEWFEEHPDVVMNVYLCSFTDNEYKFYLNLIKS